MRKKDKAKKELIIQFANQFYDTNGTKPTVREIANGTGIAISTVHRYLTEMNEENVIVYSGRHSVNTLRINTGMARSMIHEVAVSLKSEHLLSASTKALTVDPSISSKLVLMDLKLNCLNKVDYNEIYNLKKSFDGGNERFASRILDSIIGYFLNYNNCDHALRAKLCALCGFSEQKQLISTHANLLN